MRDKSLETGSALVKKPLHATMLRDVRLTLLPGADNHSFRSNPCLL
jgi:hypothetical protein